MDNFFLIINVYCALQSIVGWGIMDYFRRLWRAQTLRTKIVLPLTGLMLTALAGSVIVFIISTAATRDRLLEAQTRSDVHMIESHLHNHAADVGVAAILLANDPNVVGNTHASSTTALNTLNARAVIMRDRFRLDLIQIYNPNRQPRVNLVLATLFRQSTLNNRILTTEPRLHQLDSRLLILSSVPVSGGGEVITGLDIEAELERMAQIERLPFSTTLSLANPSLSIPQWTTKSGFFEYVSPIQVADSTLLLTIRRQTSTIAEVTNAGLVVVIGSLLVTTLLLIGLGFAMALSIAKPVREMAATAQALAEGDLSRRMALVHGGEIGSLARSFNVAADRLEAVLLAQRKETQRERAMLASIGDGVVVCDAQGRIVVINTAAYKIIGAAEAERLRLAAERGEVMNQFYAALEAIQPALDAALGRSRLEALPNRITLAGRTFRVNTSPIWMDDLLLGAVASLQDISAEVESERLRSEFIAIAAHELRTPLTSIRGFADLLHYSDMSSFSADQRLFVDVIDRNAQRLNELIADLLDISKIDQYQTNASPRPVDLVQLVHDAVDLFMDHARRSEITLTTTIDERIPLLRLDPSHIKRIIQNLISNAIKYTPAGGKIHIVIQARSDDILLAVRDTGVGIPPNDQPRIFGRFFRADNPLSREVGGTGLGLAITKSLVELNHGSIFFESMVGQGTTFYVAFPMALATPQLLELATSV